jgi:bifunctional aspartokinase / homoserine dehydrogenase 1
MSFLAMKFGGTSVGSAERIRQSAEIVRRAGGEHSVVVVVSALSGITDLIIQTANEACAGDGKAQEARLLRIEQRHDEVIEALFRGPRRDAVKAAVAEVLIELREFCSALYKFRSTTPQLLDVALSMGERMSAPIFAGQLCESGVDGRAFDSKEFLITDDAFGDAAPDMQATSRRSRECLMPFVKEGGIPVVTGYRGATAAGQPTTLGRGGSDYSATILGAALGCDEIWIWTDVSGVMSADPRLCPDATTLAEVTFAEAIEMSYYGAKVIHRKAIRPAMQSAIPVLIKNSFRPEDEGTRIAAAAQRNGHAVKAVTGVCPAALITLNMPGGHFEDLFGRLFLGLGHERIDVLFSTHSSSENALGLVFREQDLERALAIIERVFRTELKHSVVAPIAVQRNIAVIAVLGETMKGKIGVLARLFSAVARGNVSVIAVAQGASELNICFAVAAESAPVVVRAVHDEFLGAWFEPRHLCQQGEDDEQSYASRCCS